MSPADNDQSEAELLKALLAERDLPCPVCGYNLRAIASTNCPECGATLDLRVGSTDLKLGPWVVSLLALSLSLGCVALYTIITGIPILLSPYARDSPGIFTWFAITLTFGVGCTLLLWRLIRTRKKFWAKPRKAQCRSAVLYALLPSAILVSPVVIRLLSRMF
ncbi:MAG: hypothetical protein IH830_08210 [Planctomycetes bacterium]|nr:hypothetical protein [Planctomycetota bacterium]